MDALKVGGIFISGIVVGSVLTYFLIKDHIQEKADEETEAFMEHYRSKIKVMEGNDESKDEEDSEESSDPNKEDIVEYGKRTSEYSEESFTDYTSAYPSKKSEHSPENVDIEIINQYTFDLEDDYDKTLLYYYDVDGILTTEEDVYIPDHEVEDYIGYKGLQAITGGSEDYLYIRNFKEKTDFKIQRIFSRYNDLN